MNKLTSAGGFWLSYFLLLCLLPTVSFGEVTSDSSSGAISGAASKAGAIGFIDQSVNTSKVDAVEMGHRAPGVFSAGITAGGSNPCVVSIGGGLSVPGGGINFANAYNDGECNVRETLRLMAAISSSAEASNQVLLREISCQSVTMWDAFERTFNATGDERYFCTNERPEDKGRFIAGRARHAPVSNVAYDLDGGNPVKHKVVSSMLSRGYEDDAWAMLMEN